LIAANWLPRASVLAALGSFALGAVLGPEPLVLLVAGTGAGLAYDLFLKNTGLSWLPFVIAFAVLPPYVWSALDVFRDDFLWLYFVASPLTLAVHVANTLPDIESDASAGRRSVAVALGRRRALWLLSAALAAPVALLAVTLPWVEHESTLLGATLTGYGALLAGAAIAYSRLGRSTDVWAFRCVVVAAVLFASGWLAAV
jgi:4-hydroxybenzoate polyprenyltransferase